MRALLVLACAGASPVFAAQDQQQLYGACFAATYDAAHLASRPGQRVAGMSVGFQGFEGSLLASVSYRLRFGTRFGFSGDCTPGAGGEFQCKSCGSGGCPASTQTFKIRWSGGDTLELVNDTTGLFGENPAGGRDRVAPGKDHAMFPLTRAADELCAP